MLDVTDIFESSKTLFVGILRFLWWLGWDILIETVFWAVGWLALRCVTLGHYPTERLGEQDAASWRTAFVVQVVGALVLAALIWLLSGAWPSP